MLYTKFSKTYLPFQDVWCAYCDTFMPIGTQIFLQETAAIMKESTKPVEYTIMCEPCHKRIRNQCMIHGIKFEDDATRINAMAMPHTVREDF